jgi:hypothetical protein
MFLEKRRRYMLNVTVLNGLSCWSRVRSLRLSAAMNVNIVVLCDVRLYSDRNVPMPTSSWWNMKLWKQVSSILLVHFYQTPQRHISDNNLQLIRFVFRTTLQKITSALRLMSLRWIQELISEDTSTSVITSEWMYRESQKELMPTRAFAPRRTGCLL